MAKPTSTLQAKADLLWSVPLDRIDPSPFQPRHHFDPAKLQQLADDIALNGLLQPITCRPVGERFELICGERRVRAARLIISQHDIEAKLVEVDDLTARRMCYAENIQRDDLSPIEEAEAVMLWLDSSMLGDPEYAAQDDDPVKRVAWLLTKLDSDRRTGTDYVSTRFSGKVKDALRQCPRPMEWISFLHNDFGLTTLSDEVKAFAAREKLNKSKAKEMQKVQDQAPELFAQIVETGQVAVLDREAIEYKQEDIEETSAKDIADALRRHLQQEDRAALQERTKRIVFPAGTYSVIYADPPWSYGNSGFTQSAASHYPTMPTEDICGLAVPSLCTADTVLFLWATSPLLPDAMDVIDAWDFVYKASLIWDKGRAPGIGWFVETQHEFLLIATRDGNRHPAVRPESVLHIPPTGHSSKPQEVYEIVESMYPGPYLELFARNKRDGWESWGNEV